MSNQNDRKAFVMRSVKKQTTYTANGKSCISIPELYDAIIVRKVANWLQIMTTKPVPQSAMMKARHIMMYDLHYVIDGKTYEQLKAGPFTVTSGVKEQKDDAPAGTTAKFPKYSVLRQVAYTDVLTDAERDIVALGNVDSKYSGIWDERAATEVKTKYPSVVGEERDKLIAEAKANIIKVDRPAKQGLESKLAQHEYMFDVVMRAIDKEFKALLETTLSDEMKSKTTTPVIKTYWDKSKPINSFYQTVRKPTTGKDDENTIAEGKKVALEYPNIYLTFKAFAKSKPEYNSFKDIGYDGPIFAGKIWDATKYPEPRTDIKDHKAGTMLMDEDKKFRPINPDNIKRWFTPNSIASTYLTLQMSIGSDKGAAIRVYIAKEFKAIIAPRSAHRQDTDDELQGVNGCIYDTNVEVVDPMASFAGTYNAPASAASTAATSSAPSAPSTMTVAEKLAAITIAKGNPKPS